MEFASGILIRHGKLPKSRRGGLFIESRNIASFFFLFFQRAEQNLPAEF